MSLVCAKGILLFSLMVNTHPTCFSFNAERPWWGLSGYFENMVKSTLTFWMSDTIQAVITSGRQSPLNTNKAFTTSILVGLSRCLCFAFDILCELCVFGHWVAICTQECLLLVALLYQNSRGQLFWSCEITIVSNIKKYKHFLHARACL